MDSGDELFYSRFIDTSNESSNDDIDILVAAVTLIHNFNETGLPRHVGSVIGHASALNRDRENVHYQLWKGYFNPVTPTYPAHIFRCRFWMAKHVFTRIQERG